MKKTFILKIKLGNEEMKTQYDIIGALNNTIRTLRVIPEEEFLNYIHNMHDINGNTVGKWSVKHE
jgi:hypothetical protein